MLRDTLYFNSKTLTENSLVNMHMRWFSLLDHHQSVDLIPMNIGDEVDDFL